jgi:hypothetical protein
MNIKELFILLFIIYIIMSLFAHRFQTLTSAISKNLNGGNLDTEYLTMMTPTFMGFIVIFNFINLTILFIILVLNTDWYKAFVVLIFPFIIPFLEYFIPILPQKTMVKIIKSELYKNISSTPEKVIILNYIENIIEKNNKNNKI